MPSGIPEFDEECAWPWPLGLDDATVNGIFPQLGEPWAATAKWFSPSGAKDLQLQLRTPTAKMSYSVTST
jgi:hypothetical protein